MEVAYGSQKKLAESLGVSARTIRRWKYKGIPVRKSGSKYDESKIKRRIKYFTYEKKPDVLQLNPFQPIMWTDIGNWADETIAENKLVYDEFEKILKSGSNVIITIVLQITHYQDGIISDTIEESHNIYINRNYYKNKKIKLDFNIAKKEVIKLIKKLMGKYGTNVSIEIINISVEKA